MAAACQSSLDMRRNSHRSCCVPCCTNTARNTSKNVSFHQFPTSENLTKIWLEKIRRNADKKFRVSRDNKVCSEHFLVDDFRPLLHSKRRYLKPTAFPTIFQWNSSKKEKSQHDNDKCMKKNDRKTPRKHKIEVLESTNELLENESSEIDNLQDEICMLKHENQILNEQMEQYQAAQQKREQEMEELRKNLQELKELVYSKFLILR